MSEIYTCRKLVFRLSLLTLVLAFLNACASIPISPNRTPSSLDPRGPGAARIADLWWLMFGFGLFVFLLVVIILILALMRRQRATNETPPAADDGRGWKWVIWGGIVLPIVIILIVFGSTIVTLAALSSASESPAFTIHVTGRRWWWEVSYRAHGVETANEIHIPVGVPVELILESVDVIHSIWIPQLHGKMDAIPSRVNKLVIQADDAGIYRGECAEYCGLQHAHMGFMLVAESQADFDTWILQQQRPAPNPNDEAAVRGQQVFLKGGCTYCHSIKGLDDSMIDASQVDLGPDLTHLYSRLTIAGAALTNNRGNLAGWIVDAQHVKPGSLMPPVYLDSQALQDLLAYLETLV